MPEEKVLKSVLDYHPLGRRDIGRLQKCWTGAGL